MNIKKSGSVEEIISVFESKGDSEYGGEAVTQIEHALQAAMLAEKEGATSELISAALLHDYGHLVHDLPEDAPDNGIDDRHETTGKNHLVDLFPLSVTEPIRLHVAAKRYLCSVDENYLGLLSEPSIVSLNLQGGKMSPDEIRQFESNEFYQDAVRLRRWDDQAKIPDLPTPNLMYFKKHLQKSCKQVNALEHEDDRN